MREDRRTAARRVVLYKIATPKAKIALPKMTDNNRSEVIIVSGTIAMIKGKTKLPKSTLKRVFT